VQAIKWATLIFGALFVVVAAGAINAPHLYYMAAILLTLPAISYLLGYLSLYRLTLSREIPSSAWAGEVGELHYVVENPTKVARYFLSCREPLPNWITPASDAPLLFNAAPSSTSRIAYRLNLLRRGVYGMEGFDVVAIDPLGVFSFKRSFLSQTELVVYPTPQQLSHWQMEGAERNGWQEFSLLALHGNSVDPDGVRQYVPGDPLRRIHWRQTARTGQLSVIEFEESQSIQVYMILDQQKGHDFGSGVETSFEYAVRFCASVAWEVIQQNTSAKLIVLGDDGEPRIDSSVQSRNELQLVRILEALARVEAHGTKPISQITHDLAGVIPSGNTLVVVTSSADVALGEALALHRTGGIAPIVVFVDPDSFREQKNTLAPRVPEAFEQAVRAAGATLFVVRKHAEGGLYPEGVHHGDGQ
jgi:uncharacterized protein (DUF58 family)